MRYYVHVRVHVCVSCQWQLVTQDWDYFNYPLFQLVVLL